MLTRGKLPAAAAASEYIGFGKFTHIGSEAFAATRDSFHNHNLRCDSFPLTLAKGEDEEYDFDEEDVRERPTTDGAAAAASSAPRDEAGRSPRTTVRGTPLRSGRPPSPPKWKYDRRDPRSYTKWVRQVEVWRRRVLRYVDPGEAGLALYNALEASGAPEEELEYVDLDKVDDVGGIDYLVEYLRKPFAEKIVNRKGKFLTDHERIRRQERESLRDYINRYKRVHGERLEAGGDRRLSLLRLRG